MRRNSFKLAKKPQNLSQDENVIFLVVIREKKLTFLLSPQANLRSGDLRLPFCLGDEKKKGAVSQVNHRQTRRTVCQIPVIIKHQALWVRERESELESTSSK